MQVELETKASSSQKNVDTIICEQSESPYEVYASPQKREYLLVWDKKKIQIKPSQRYGFENIVAYARSVAESIDSFDPTSYFEAIQAPNTDKWLIAMEEELESLHENGTWELVKPPTDKRAIGRKWVFKKKDGSSIEDIGYKARLDAKGYSQVEGVDFHDVFSLVLKHTSICLYSLLSPYTT